MRPETNDSKAFILASKQRLLVRHDAELTDTKRFSCQLAACPFELVYATRKSCRDTSEQHHCGISASSRSPLGGLQRPANTDAKVKARATCFCFRQDFFASPPNEEC